MLNRFDMKSYRELRGLSYRQVADHRKVSHTMISEIEKGNKALTEYTYREILRGINAAYSKKQQEKLKQEVIQEEEKLKPAQKQIVGIQKNLKNM